MANAEQGGPALVANGLQALYRRLVTFPTATVAAVNGHAFAGGGMLALACDQRVMRTDRGFFCLPEVDINIPFTKGMAALVQCKLVPSVARDAMLSGRRYSGPDAVAAGIADSAVPEDQVVATAIELAKPFAGKSPSVVSTIKKTMFAPALAGLEEVVEFGI
jgi:enoyl-CoA hydratase/carnithine racemase